MELIKNLKEITLLKNLFLAIFLSMLLAISAKIKIPFYPVPMTMQTFVVLLIGVLFGWKLGLFTVGLYLLEGKYGSAGLSAASMIPFLGNWVAGKRALLKAKLAGEEMVTLYRGVEGIDDANAMVKNNNIIGNWGKTFDSKKSFGSTTSTRKPLDSVYGKKGFMVSSVPKNVDISKTLFTTWDKKLAKTYTKKGGMILEFEVPKSYINKYGRNPFGSSMSRKGQGWGEEGFKNAIDASYDSVIFTEGLPVDFLKTTHKGIKAPDPVLKYQELKDKILKDR